MWWLSCQALETWLDVDESRKEKGKVTVRFLWPLPGATGSSYGPGTLRVPPPRLLGVDKSVGSVGDKSAEEGKGPRSSVAVTGCQADACYVLAI